MHFTTEQGDATTVFRLKEDKLDSRNAGQLKAEFLILSQPDIDALIVDLSEVRHIDSAGISALLLAQRQMKIHEGELRLVGVRPDVMSMLRLTQLDRIFPIFNTVEEALAAELALPDEEEEFRSEAEFEEGDEPELSLGPGAPSTKAIKAGAIVAGGTLGAAAIAKIMMTPYDDELSIDPLHASALGDDEGLVDDDFDDDDDLDEDLEEEDDDLDEEDDAEDVEEVADDVIEEDDLEDDDFDDEELEEDEEDDF